jgi:hypothetical protein
MSSEIRSALRFDRVIGCGHERGRVAGLRRERHVASGAPDANRTTEPTTVEESSTAAVKLNRWLDLLETARVAPAEN